MVRFTFSFIVLLAAPASIALGQAGPALGDDFIFFRNGANASLPHVAGNLEADPQNPGQFSMRYDYGDWSYQFFGWDAAVGVDMTANLSDTDSLFLMLKVDQANTNDNTFLLLEDKTNGQPDDLPMRLVWRIPNMYKDGNWHALEIPLPPALCADLASARGTLGLGDHWWYGGSWSNATQRVGDYDDECGGTTNNPQYWKEYEWTNVHSVGVFWDHNAGGGSIWVDDVYIGRQGLDLTVADNPAAALSSATITAMSSGNMISWTHDAASGIGAYKVYGTAVVDTSDLTGLDATMFNQLVEFGALSFMGQIGASASDHSIMHHFAYLTPGAAQFSSSIPFTYVITTVSEFGLENYDGYIEYTENDMIEEGPFIGQLTDAQTSLLFTSLTSGNVSGDGFGDDWPVFEINMNRFSIADVPTPPDNDADLSGKFWLGYSEDNELYLYAEVMDDIVELPTSEDPGTAPWEYDVIEMGWANYQPTDLFFGTHHQNMVRGATADYQFRIGGKGDGSQAFIWVDPGVGGIPTESAAEFSVLTDGSGTAIGYAILALIPLDGIQDPATGDAVVLPPLGQEIEGRSIDIVLNDRDNGARQSQIQWTLKYIADGQWWNTPAQWEPIWMLGNDQFVLSADLELPDAFELQQNYPNPFNPQTNISFTLPSAERVTLTVHDLLGRTVATVLSSQTLGSGRHTFQFDARGLSSGMYVYRLQAGANFTQAKSMVLIK